MANTNGPWAYIGVGGGGGSLSKGYLRLRFEELIFGRAYFRRGLLFDYVCR